MDNTVNIFSFYHLVCWFCRVDSQNVVFDCHVSCCPGSILVAAGGPLGCWARSGGRLDCWARSGGRLDCWARSGGRLGLLSSLLLVGFHHFRQKIDCRVVSHLFHQSKNFHSTGCDFYHRSCHCHH